MQVVENGQALQCQFDDALPAHFQINHPAISRVSTDKHDSKVRVSYTVLNSHSRQEVKIVNLEVSDSMQGAPVLASAPRIACTIHANTGQYSMTLGTFIDPDFVDMPVSAQSNTAMFYWLEYPVPVGGKEDVYARFCILDGDGFCTSPRELSIGKGTPRGWSSALPVGDYLTGGFFYHNHSLGFVGQWLEPEGIKANVVTVRT